MIANKLLQSLTRKGEGTARDPFNPGAADPNQIMYWPPLALSVEPVMNPASSATRKTTHRAISSGSPSRRTGMSGRIDFSSTSFGTAFTISVAI